MHSEHSGKNYLKIYVEDAQGMSHDAVNFSTQLFSYNAESCLHLNLFRKNWNTLVF